MSDERKLSERFAEAVDNLLADHEDDHEGWPHVVRQQRLANLVATNRDRILEALRRDEDPKRPIADRLLAICENPDAFSVGHDPRDPALSQLRRACAALLALAKGTAP